tara:strand:- start:3222 stop:4676 length:1455 start_codon:yes stop_codon:yes gene_type:complete
MEKNLLKIPVVIDLDNTLTSVDTLFEAVIILIKHKLVNIILMIWWLTKGKLYFKSKLIDHVQVDPKKIPYNNEVISFIKESRSQGRKIILCSGAHVNQVKLIADHLNLFDSYYGSDSNTNLSGKNKSEFLVEKYGKGNFDYVGDSHVDLHVWNNCRTIYSVYLKNKTKRKLLNSIRKNQDYIELISQNSLLNELSIIIRTIRAHQWIKNILLFVPIFLSQLYNFSSVISVLLAFLCFSLLASSIYIVNDIFDLSNDRSHPTKKNRSIASGKISIVFASIIAISLFVISTSLSFFLLSLNVLSVLLIYFVVNLLYTFYLKSLFLLDVVMLSSFYVLRIYVGGLASGVEVSTWLILCSFAFFLFLAMIKRLTEIILKEKETSITDIRAYSSNDSKLLKLGIIVTSITSLILFAGYLQTDKVYELYHNPKLLLLIIPIVCYWQLRIFLSTLKGKMHDDPILFVAKDLQSWACVIISSIIVIYQMQIW